MKLLSVCQFILFCLFLTAPDESNAQTEKFQIRRGTNIAHWLSQSRERGALRDSFFNRTDIRQIKAAGFDHIRLPVDEVQLWDSLGNREKKAFELLDNCLRWCKEEKLKVVLDMHIIRSHYFDAKDNKLWKDKAEQDKFILLWKDLSSAVKNYPNSMLAYEFMNEPVADDPQQWNSLLARVADSIRSWEKERVLVIGSNRYQSAQTFDKLIVPANDKNLILSFHFYEPFMLTHFRAGWTNQKDFKGQVNYPGQISPGGISPEEQRIYNKEVLIQMMSKALKLADSLRLPLYCGEFGAISQAPRESKLNWYRDMISIFNERGIAWANWNYKAGSFGIVDRNRKEDQEMFRIFFENK